VNLDWRKYFFVFVITAAIFGTAVYLNFLFNERRLAEIQSIQARLSTDILSLETQFDLLGEISCSDIKDNSLLSSELNDLSERLSFTEEQLGSNNSQVIQLKQQYSLLEIKDYLLMKKVTEKCQTKPVFILYFYSNTGDCEDCGTEGDVLTYFRTKYPQLRVYAFDYHLDLSALRTLISINKLENRLPALVINGKAYYGFQDREAIEKILPVLKEFDKENAAAALKATATSSEQE